MQKLHSNNKILYIIIGILFVCISSILIVKNTTKQEYSSHIQPTIIHAAGVKSIGVALFLVAEKMNYFAEENIQMDINWMAGGDQVFKALTSKSTDIGFVGLVPYGFVGQQFPSIKLVTVIADMNDSKIITKDTIQNPGDIVGKTIGYSKSTASDIGLQQFMKKNNIDPHSVKLINLSPSALPTAFYKGEIDGYAAREPNIYNGKKLMSGNVTIFDNKDQKYEWYFSLFADQSYIKLHKDTITHMTNALQKAEIYIKQHPGETKQLLSQFLNIDVSTLNSIWDDYTFHQSIEEKHIEALKDIFTRANMQKGNTTGTMNNISTFIAK